MVQECSYERLRVPDYRITVFQYGLDAEAFQAKYRADRHIGDHLGKGHYLSGQIGVREGDSCVA